jgi:ribulose-phosphate 3-epimerase
MTIIAPSVLAADLGRLDEQIRELDQTSAEWIHYDVMDGHFVPNLSFGPAVLKAVEKNTGKLMDVHLMVQDPLAVMDYFGSNRVSNLTFHYEAVDGSTLLPGIEKARANGWKVGLSIKPATPPEVLTGILEKLDLVLVMSVEPGFGGQQFMPQALDKLDWLAEYRRSHHLDFLLEIDGGINQQTGRLAVAHGCDVLVAGTYVFRHPRGMAWAVQSLKEG